MLFYLLQTFTNDICVQNSGYLYAKSILCKYMFPILLFYFFLSHVCPTSPEKIKDKIYEIELASFNWEVKE